ncbi:MAG: TetR/AcrR family transcriptional regulator [Clostridium sp.]|uniref:TetR/AcrR family transcriptional regulator n=1 Tax=Clostridium sp. TaxID=1506 RepID=UPI003D6C8B4C
MKINPSEMKIKQIAFESFANKGYEGTNIRDICNKAGIKMPTLYYYFESKEKLFFSILNETIEMFINYNTDSDFFKSIVDTKMEPGKKLFLIYMRRMNFYQNYKKEYKLLYRYMVFYPEEFEEKILNCYLEMGNTINKCYSFVFIEIVEGKLITKDNLNEFISEYNAFINTNIMHHFFYYKEIDPLRMKNQWERFWGYATS